MADLVGLFPELLGFGGVQEAGRQTACALENILSGREWSATYLGLNDLNGPHALENVDQSIPFRGFQRSKVRFALRALLLARNKPRIIVAAHPNLALPVLWMKRLSPATKTIVLCHGVEVWNRLPARRREALLGADLVLAPSTYTAEKLTSIQGVAAKKVRVLAWPASAEMLRMSDERSKLRLPTGFPEGRVILTVGRWAASERYKGADDLIRAMPQLLGSFPDLHLVAVGGGDDLVRLKTIAAEFGITSSVKFFERISVEQLAACYARAEIFALPSTGEGFGIVFLEAMGFGVPVVAAAAGGVTDIVKDGVNGLLVPGRDAVALVQSLDRLLSDPGFASALGRRGAEIVRQKYRLQVFKRELEAILIECGLDSIVAT